MGTRTTAVAAAMLIAASVCSAQLHLPPPIAAHESGVQKIMFIESGEVVYNFRWSLDRFTKDGRTFARYEGHGDNNTKGSERIEWKEEALYEITPQGLKTVYWKKQSSGAEQMTWLLEYDWKARKVRYSWSDALTGKKEEKVLEFEEGAIAGDSLNFNLRGFPFEKGEGYRYRAQIIMSNGTLLNGYVIHRGEEKLKTAFGEIDAYKLELKPTGLVGVVAPKMYIWYTKSEPHIWLRFDGKDADLWRPRTKNVLLKYEPSEWIKP
ncbi:MAG TPA: hypothetical protein ENF73_01535 [Proteobacteria bacterium]|nr:hypothetical protein [Pseudomonadota bacterium]